MRERQELEINKSLGVPGSANMILAALISVEISELQTIFLSARRSESVRSYLGYDQEAQDEAMEISE